MLTAVWWWRLSKCCLYYKLYPMCATTSWRWFNDILYRCAYLMYRKSTAKCTDYAADR